MRRRCADGEGRRPARRRAFQVVRWGATPLALLASVLLLACAPTAGTRATASPTPSATPAATAVPCPPATAPTSPEGRQLMAAVAAAVGPDAHCLDTTYRAQDRTAAVTATVDGSVPLAPADIATAQERSKALCFRAQKALWTSGVALSATTVLVLGPVLDPYVNVTAGPYASADLTARTAATFMWSRLDPDTAWGKYDSVFLRPAYNTIDNAPTAVP